MHRRDLISGVCEKLHFFLQNNAVQGIRKDFAIVQNGACVAEKG